ncbi:MAG TPA: hypothetical protein VLD59_09905 [Steroidobacteraceae bacterium]|nr:hypothetical protein [Steroidobacteraceae bacterium]
MRLWLARKLLGRRDPRVIWLLPYVGGPTERDRNILIVKVAEAQVERAMEAWRRKQLLLRYRSPRRETSVEQLKRILSQP